MLNSQNEDHSGAVITEIAPYSDNNLRQHPNNILVMAGTNNINKPSDPERAPERRGRLIDKLITACPDAANLVAQIAPIVDPSKEALAKPFNAAVPGIVASRASSGAKVIVVDMSSFLTADNLADGLHPNDIGYNLMDRAWNAGL